MPTEKFQLILQFMNAWGTWGNGPARAYSTVIPTLRYYGNLIQEVGNE
jgi:hypothetical protein